MLNRIPKQKYATISQMERIDELLAMEPPRISIIEGAKNTSDKTKEQGMSKAEILADSNVRFVYSKGRKTIHDKACSCVENISLNNMRTSSSFISTKKLCPECEVLSYIRAGGDFKNKDKYIEFFDKAYFDMALIKRLFVTDKAKTKINGNVLSIRMRGKAWKLRLLHEGKRGLEILHSNYTVEGGDIIEENVFRSISKYVTAEKALKMMEHMSFENETMEVESDEDRSHSKKDFFKKLWEAITYKANILLGIVEPKDSIYFIDGDNNPEFRIKGIEQLNENDLVKIFSAENMSHYRDPEKRKQLRDKTKCIVEFISVKPGPDAVDFAIGMDAYKMFLKSPCSRICLLSADKHFAVIKRQLDAFSDGNAKVVHVATIQDACA